MRSNEGKLIYIYERVTIINNLETNYVESIIKEVRKTAEEIFNKHMAKPKNLSFLIRNFKNVGAGGEIIFFYLKKKS